MIFKDIHDIGDQYDLICADPPWKQSKGGKKSVRKNSSGTPLKTDYEGLQTFDKVCVLLPMYYFFLITST